MPSKPQQSIQQPTTPVTGLLSAILIYLTFSQQQRALSDEMARNQVVRDIERIKEQFEGVMEYVHRITYTSGGQSLTGLQAILNNQSLGHSGTVIIEWMFVVHLLITTRNNLEAITTPKNSGMETLLKKEQDALLETMKIYAEKIILLGIDRVIERNRTEKIQEAKLQETQKQIDDLRRAFDIT